VTWPTATT